MHMDYITFWILEQLAGPMFFCPKLLSHHLPRFFTKSINRKLGFHLPSKQDSSFKIAIWNSPAVPETKTTSNLAVAKCRAHVSPAKIGAQLCYHHESWIHLRTCFSRQDQPAWWNCSPEKNSWETADDDVRFPDHGRQKFPGESWAPTSIWGETRPFQAPTSWTHQPKPEEDKAISRPNKADTPTPISTWTKTKPF